MTNNLILQYSSQNILTNYQLPGDHAYGGFVFNVNVFNISRNLL